MKPTILTYLNILLAMKFITVANWCGQWKIALYHAKAIVEVSAGKTQASGCQKGWSHHQGQRFSTLS